MVSRSSSSAKLFLHTKSRRAVALLVCWMAEFSLRLGGRNRKVALPSELLLFASKPVCGLCCPNWEFLKLYASFPYCSDCFVASLCRAAAGHRTIPLPLNQVQDSHKRRCRTAPILRRQSRQRPQQLQPAQFHRLRSLLRGRSPRQPISKSQAAQLAEPELVEPKLVEPQLVQMPPAPPPEPKTEILDSSATSGALATDGHDPILDPPPVPPPLPRWLAGPLAALIACATA